MNKSFRLPASGVLATFVSFLSCLATAGETASSTGTVEGRVFSGVTGDALANARVTLAGGTRESLTDSRGYFVFPAVPVGQARVSVSYIGLESRTEQVVVEPGATARMEIELARTAEATAQLGKAVELAAVTVVADREMNAQAIAMNEQRHAPNIKNVVAIDEYGDRGNENIGEFLLFLPGVSIETSGSEPTRVSLRGIPGEMTGLRIDGGEVAGSFAGNDRSLDLREVPTGNISRVEITKVPTPDMPATGLGGSINLISRSGFEAKKPRLVYNVYMMFDNRLGLDFDAGERNHASSTSPDTIQPSFDFSYLHPVNSSLAFTVGAARTWRFDPMERDANTDETAAWHLGDLYQRTSQWQSLAQTFETRTGQFGVDWRVTPKDAFTFSFQHRDYFLNTTRSVIAFNYGAGAFGDANFTQGATPGVGSVTQGANGVNRRNHTRNRTLTLKYNHRGDFWRVDGFGSFSAARTNHQDIGQGYFSIINASITQLVLRGDGIQESVGILPARYSALNRAGAVVDVYDGGNYTFNSAQADEANLKTDRMVGKLDVSRDFFGETPVTIKAGVAVDRTERDQRRFPMQWTFAPNGSTAAAARQARNFDLFDTGFNAVAPTLNGIPVTWISLVKAYELYQSNPSWFVLNEPAAHQGQVNNSRRLIETVSAAYVRADLKLMNNKLWIASGVRFERTSAEGRGPLNDINAQFQRDAAGNFILNPAGQRVPVTADPLELSRLQFQERGAHASRTYDGFYPSINASYSITDELILRAAYARTLGRPNINFIIPGTTVSSAEAAVPTITVNNTGLLPWTANSYDLTLEAYNIKGGVGSVGVFHKTIKNFFGQITTEATPELLESHGLGGDSSLLGYNIATRINAGDATVRGMEFTYRQSLTFLPHWARGIQVFANVTKLEVDGENAADFSGFNPTSFSGGISFIRDRYSVKLTYSYLDETRGNSVAVGGANGIPPDTFMYQGKQTRLGLNAQYSFSPRYSIYASTTDLGGFDAHIYRYGPNTPPYARHARLQKLGYFITIGLRGTF